MESVKARIKKNNKTIKEKEKQVEEMHARYDSDLKRYRELKSYQQSSRRGEDEDE